ncbi:hypothetical protein ACRALDRAFT_2040107 [Sodiomyces alcalophilus JCM 7366]|uniref:uncharacterized protein n=1 Tax=Sodiomyces alcalophilus JCM 7366 TaxID=591952 RepID=UPI0039B5CE64
MGVNQSKQRPQVEPGELSDKALCERLEKALDRNRSADEASPGPASIQEKEESTRLVREPQGLSRKLVLSWQDDFLQDPRNRLALKALTANNPRSLLTSAATTRADHHIFNIRIPVEGGPVTHQRSSGRCWLFAATNVFRVSLMNRYNLASFEFSQSYLFFWDKLEKANWFLEQIIDTAHGHDLDSRLVQHLLAQPVSDGGQWDMVANLVRKYGVVPKALYPDTWSASNSAILNSVLKSKLREHAVVLRRLVRQENESGTEKKSAAATSRAVSDAKARMLRDILGVLTVTLGSPPDPRAAYIWMYEDMNGKACEVRTTPHALAMGTYGVRRIVSMGISLVHDPRHPPLTLLTVERLGNIVGRRSATYVNVNMATLKGACVASLREGQPVFFGSDIGKFSSSASGVMDLDLFDYELGFGVGLRGLDKADRLRAGDSQMTHAMILTGVHVDASGRTVRWRVQNSWGDQVGQKGWFVMSDAWMDEYVYQAVVDPVYLAKEVRDVLKKTPVVLPPWDPMGSLA